jgi:hypothetical protein
MTRFAGKGGAARGTPLKKFVDINVLAYRAARPAGRNPTVISS